MSLQLLPEELLVIIIRQLDLKSLIRLYQAGNTHINNVISSQGVIKKCHFTLNDMATVHSLKTIFFQNVSFHLQELSLSGVCDLNKTLLLQAMTKLKSLLTLDVSYTSICISDLLDVYEKCPTIKNISVDYKFYRPGSKKPSIEVLTKKCQTVFANFKNVTFVGSLNNLIFSRLPHFILEKAELDTLIYNITRTHSMFSCCIYDESKSLSCNIFFINMLNWKPQFKLQNIQNCTTEDIFKHISFEYEYILIYWKVYCSALFAQFLEQRFKIKAVVIKFPLCCLMSNCTFMIWRKETTNFDDSFFSDLYSRLKPYFPNLRSYSEDVQTEPLHSDWVSVTHSPLDFCEDDLPENQPVFKKRRLAASSVKLDYDRYLENLERAKLSVKFCNHIRRPVSISPQSDFLKKITFLSLTGSVRYSGEFFNVLFRQCNNLVTLNVEAPSVSVCVVPISRSIPLSHSMKNLRIVDKNIDFISLLSSLAQCKTLENIQILDQSMVPNHLSNADPLFQQCSNLYYFSILARMSDTAKKNYLQMLNKSKLKCGRNTLCIELLSSSDTPDYTYDPYVEVFELCPIKAVKKYLRFLFRWFP